MYGPGRIITSRSSLWHRLRNASMFAKPSKTNFPGAGSCRFQGTYVWIVFKPNALAFNSLSSQYCQLERKQHHHIKAFNLNKTKCLSVIMSQRIIRLINLSISVILMRKITREHDSSLHFLVSLIIKYQDKKKKQNKFKEEEAITFPLTETQSWCAVGVQPGSCWKSLSLSLN